MTDLFISATATLLIVLALSNPVSSNRIPIQADLFGYCMTDISGEGADEVAVPNQLLVSDQPDGAYSYVVTSPDSLALAPRHFAMPERLFYTLAVEPSADAPLSAACLSWAETNLVSAWNQKLTEPEVAEGASRAVFSLVPLNGTTTDPNGEVR